MRGKAHRDSPILKLLASPGKYMYSRMIGQCPVRNMISTPNFTDGYLPFRHYG